MKVEILYIPGCPNSKPALDRVHEALSEEGLCAHIKHVEVNDIIAAESFDFPGSPTVRINGLDVETSLPLAGPAGLSCRTYWNGSVREGAPSVAVIRRAISAATGSIPDEAH